MSGLNAPVPPKVAPKPGKVKVVRALYNYTAQHSDELTFQEGDLLYVFDQISDQNWWKARCGDHSGLIPSNYVESSTEEICFPLHEAARRGNLSYLRECLQQGVSASGLDHASNTALFWASHAGHLECVQELLALPNPPVNAQNRLGDTPLHAAGSHDHRDVVSLLLEAGADVGLRNNEGLTAQEMATPGTRSSIQSASLPHSRHLSAMYTAEDYEDEGSD